MLRLQKRQQSQLTEQFQSYKQQQQHRSKHRRQQAKT